MKKDERLNFSDRTPSVRRLVVSLVLMLLAVLPERIYFGMMKYERVILIVLLAAVWGGFLDGPLSVMNNVVWDLLDNGTQYIDTIAYSAYYASVGAVI